MRPAGRFRSTAEPAGLPLFGQPATVAAGDAQPIPVPLVRARFEIGADRKPRVEPSSNAPAKAAIPHIA